jgi:rhodanese-related sulfurtransferase
MENHRVELAGWPEDTLFATYRAGPHCNGATGDALQLARLKRPAKIMAGGQTGWRDDGFAVASE